MAASTKAPQGGGSSSKPPAKPAADASKGAPPPADGEGEEDDDDERMDVAFIQGFADKIQRAPEEMRDGVDMSRPKITIPKRGEKDFEPLEETVNLQEMMLQKSRQALFDALQGVRGVASKSLSHAIVTPSSPYPQLIVSRGHVLDTIGITVRRSPGPGDKGKTHSRVELLPEEALYLTERGTLQIWNGRDPATEDEAAEGVGAWSDEEFGIKGAVEMSVMEVFGAFLGKDGLSWQRYQCYAYLKRLGYTAQRTREFIPEHFLAGPLPTATGGFKLRLAALARIPAHLNRLIAGVFQRLSCLLRNIVKAGCNLFRNDPFKSTALQGWSGESYSSIFEQLRFVPAGHSNPVPPSVTPKATTSIYDALDRNPYLPFFNVWKPVTAWSKAKWDRGSPQGLAAQKPDYIVAVVESRDTPMPTLTQLSEVFDILPDEPKGPTQRHGPQYQKRARPMPAKDDDTSLKGRVLALLPGWLRRGPTKPNRGGNINALRSGDRALVVAVNDSGNTGWVRFGRCGFEGVVMV